MFIENPVNTIAIVFPILEIVHIAGFAVAIGSVAAVDFRILGFGLMEQTPSQIAKATGFWMLGGLLISIFAGFGLYSSDPDMYYLNWSFIFKMIVLVAAIVLNYTVHRKIAQSDGTASGAKAIAWISLVLWASVIFGGIFIAFVMGGL
jgi:uncharacterized membrane protein